MNREEEEEEEKKEKFFLKEKNGFPSSFLPFKTKNFQKRNQVMGKELKEEKVYVGNISKQCREEDLESLFKTFGKLQSVWIARNPSGKEAPTNISNGKERKRKVEVNWSNGVLGFPLEVLDNGELENGSCGSCEIFNRSWDLDQFF